MENAVGARVGRWRALAALVLGGCVTEVAPDPEAEDGETDVAIVEGAADAFGLAEDTPLAASLLRYANGASFEELTDRNGPWLTWRVARRIIDARAGGDSMPGTVDDDPYNTLAELDAVPYVGRSVFSRLRDEVEAQPIDDTACGTNAARAFPLELAPSPGTLEARLLELIGGAVRSIDVVIYQFTSEPVRDALRDAAARGVHVRVILDRTQQENEELVRWLEENGVEARLSSESFTYTHQKTITIDEELTLVSSGNLERRSFATSRNFTAIDRDFEDVRDFDAIFEADWSGRVPELACTRLVYSPVNSRARVIALIEGATRRIDVEAMYVTDSQVFNALIDAQRRGVAVRALLNDPRFGVESSSWGVRDLRAAGGEVRKLPSLFVHAKVIMVDDAWFFVGSENFSRNSLNNNREAGLILGHDGLDLAAVRATLDADWNAAVRY
jgi:phosphatidylserine/phosphatidylglycerophosphate/cardiolipin synthase-like enzyme